jgi:hypothetical protein
MTVIPEFPVYFEDSGTFLIEVVPDLKCAAEYFDTYPVQWVVVEFVDGDEGKKLEDYTDPVEFTNARCYVGEYTGEQILNFLNRNGESFVEKLTNP